MCNANNMKMQTSNTTFRCAYIPEVQDHTSTAIRKATHAHTFTKHINVLIEEISLNYLQKEL
jgi:hypothetical protein